MKDRALVCVPLTDNSFDDMLFSARQAEKLAADAVEFRIDFLDPAGMDDLKDINKLEDLNIKKILTCMPCWEGGKFNGAESTRISMMSSISKFFDYITIELRCCDLSLFVRSARKQNPCIKVILSYHDFESTPELNTILNIIKLEKKHGADIAKIAFTPCDLEDVLRVMEALVKGRAGIPVIAISMGDAGKISRVIAPVFGSYLTFASLGEGRESAPGQMSIADVRGWLEKFSW